MSIEFSVNGTPVVVDSPPMARLLDVLREELRLTGSKEGCGEGECGACTVHVDGEAVLACLIPVCQVEGRSVRTVEGLEEDPMTRRLQEVFVTTGAAQCGICTPGFLMTTAAFLARNPHPTREEAREAIAGNLCRCTGYQKIIDAVVEAIHAPV